MSMLDEDLLELEGPVESCRARRNISGPRIREARREMGMSQEELSQRLQQAGLALSQGLISRVEIGTRVVLDYELKYFSIVFDKPLHWFLQDS